MSCLKLASAGDDIKLWDTGDFSLIKQFNPHDQNISAIAWNGKKSSWNSDNVLLCSASSNSNKISFTAVKDTAVTVSEFDCTPGGSLCVDFNSTSSYLLVGDTEGSINVWDLKSRKIKKTYKDHKGPVTCAQFNCNDTYIASGSETGEIILFNVVTGQGCSPMIAPRIQAIKQIQYSKFKKSLLGSVSDDGAVNLWDINTRRMLHSFSDSHIAPATGLNFSPINDILLMSVGLDKRIVCYDTQGKKPVKTMMAENPLTSIDVMSDGATVAVGSTRGIIYIYDLRHGNAPMKIINAHKSSVQNLKFQHGIIHEPVSGKSASSAVSPNRRQLPSAPGGKSGQHKDISEHYNRNNHSDGAAEEDVFSPVGNEYGNTSSDYKIDTGGNNSLFNTHSYHSNDSSGGLFSPLADGDNLTRRYGERTKVSPLVTNSSPSLPRHAEIPTSDYQQYNGSIHSDGNIRQNLQYSETYHGPDGDGQPSYSNTREMPFTASSHSVDRVNNTSQNANQTEYKPQVNSLGASTSDRDPGLKSPHPRGKSPQSSTSPRPQSILKSRYDSTHSQGFTAENSLNSSQSYTSKKLDDSPSGSAGGQSQSPIRTSGTPDGAHAVSLTSNGALRRSQEGSASAASIPQNFQSQFIRNMIEDAMEEFKEQIHSQYLNLHLEMIRQFQIQQNEITGLLQQYSVNHELIQEVERLREENRRLKKNF